MASDTIRRLARRIGRAGDGRYQPAQAEATLVVASVERDSAGGVLSATGTLDGAGEFTVPLRGRSAGVGDHLLVGYSAGRPVGAELVYLRHVASDNPGAGYTDDADLPPPAFAGTPWTTSIVKLPGSITAKASVFFVAVEGRYFPSGYTISYRIDGGEWRDRHVPHLGGTQECDLGADLPPSADVDVQLRTKASRTATESALLTEGTYQTADDDSSPGSVTAIAVDASVPNALRIKLSVSVDSDLLLGYIYQIATSGTGPATITTPPRMDPEWVAVLSPGTYYVRAYPISKAGVAGTPSPASNFSGPYTVLDQSANLDTTAPGAIGAPTLVTSTVQFADGTWHGYLTVTRPSYSPPSDLAAYEISIVGDDGRNWIAVEPVQAGVTSWKYEVGFAQFTVAMRGRDQAGNAPAFGSTAVATIAAPALSGTAPTVATMTVGAGIKVSWGRIDGALGYEIQRATDGSGTGATTIGTTDALWFFDPLVSDTIILPTYYYRVRPVSLQNGSVIQGTYSSWTVGTAGAIDAQNLRALSIVAGLIATDAITANKIQAGAVTAAKLEADLVLASKIRTATSGTRWEIEGHTGGGNQDQLRAYEAVSGVDKLRLMLNGTGLYLYGDGAQGDFSLARNASGRGQLTMGAMSVGTDGTGPFVSIPLTQTGGGGEIRFTGATATGKMREHSYAGYDVMGYQKTNGTLGDPVWIYYDNVGGGGGLERLALYWDGIGSYNAAMTASNEKYIRHDHTRWVATDFLAAGLHAGAMPSHVAAWLSTVYQSASLGTTGGNTQDVAAWAYPSTSQLTLRLRAYRGQSNSGQADARFRLTSDYNNEAATGGGLQLGFRNATDPLWLLEGPSGTTRMYWDHANTRVLVVNGLRVDGALSKASGTFDIAHPDPAKAERLRLRHGFVEGPTRGETVYTYVARFGPRGGALSVADSEGQAVAGAHIEAIDPPLGGVARWRVTIPLPEYWPHLNERPRCWVQGDAWQQARARVGDDLATLTLEAGGAGEYTILLIGTRKDAAARQMWDRRGAVYTQAQRTDNSSTLERRAASLADRAARRERQTQRADLAPAPTFDAAGMAMAMRGTEIEAPTETSRALAAAMGRATVAAMKGE